MLRETYVSTSQPVLLRPQPKNNPMDAVMRFVGAICAFSKRHAFLFVMLFVLALSANSSHAAAAVDSGVQNAIDSFDLTFSAVKTVVLTILVFAVGYKLAKRWLKG